MPLAKHGQRWLRPRGNHRFAVLCLQDEHSAIDPVSKKKGRSATEVVRLLWQKATKDVKDKRLGRGNFTTICLSPFAPYASSLTPGDLLLERHWTC